MKIIREFEGVPQNFSAHFEGGGAENFHHYETFQSARNS